MSSAPAAVSITSLNTVQTSSQSQSATSVILTLNVTNFRLPQDGFIVVYAVHPSTVPRAHDDDSAASNGLQQFVDAVTYPGDMKAARACPSASFCFVFLKQVSGSDMAIFAITQTLVVPPAST